MQDNINMPLRLESAERQRNTQAVLPESEARPNDSSEALLMDPMPQSYMERCILYLDQIDAGKLPEQPSYDCDCEDCWRAVERGDQKGDDPEVLLASTSEVRSFFQKHTGHKVTLRLKYEQEFADLEGRVRTVLLRQGLYRRYWIAAMDDQALRGLPGIGPKSFQAIRGQIPFSGSPNISPHLTTFEACPACYGTGLKLSEAALDAIVQRATEQSNTAVTEGDVSEPLPTIEESLRHLASAVEEIQTRLAALEKDHRAGLTTPQILMSLDEAAKAVRLRPGILWDAVMQGDMPVVRRGKGLLMVRAQALDEWIKYQERCIEREPEIEEPSPDLLCRRCRERPYYNGSSTLKLCRECHQQLKQDRMEAKEKQRAAHAAHKQPHNQP